MSKNHKVKLIIISTLMFLNISLSGCSNFNKGASQLPKKLSIVLASDLHYLSSEMTDYGDYFLDLISRSDGKVTHYTPELTKAFVSQILDMSVDALVISGDLTLNGDEESHQDLVKLLQPLLKANIEVFVIPGNHDVGGIAYRFIEDKVEEV